MRVVIGMASERFLVNNLALSRDQNRRMQNAAELHDALIDLVPGDARLFLSELGPLSEDERGLVAPRFELADTVPIGDSASNIPVIGSVPSVKSSRLALLAGGAAIIGMGALVAGSIRWRQTAVVASATERPPPAAKPPKRKPRPRADGEARRKQAGPPANHPWRNFIFGRGAPLQRS